MSSAACVHVWQASGLDLETQFWTYAFYSSPPHFKLTSKKQTFLSLCSCAPSGSLVSCTCWRCSSTGICFSASWAPSSTRNLFSGWNVSVHGKTDPRKLCTGVQSVFSPRRCKLFTMIRPFTTRRAFRTLSWMWIGRFNRPLVQYRERKQHKTWHKKSQQLNNSPCYHDTVQAADAFSLCTGWESLWGLL